MELYIGNLPLATNLGQLIAFFRGFSSKIVFHISRKKLDDGRTICFALADIGNDRLAAKFRQRFDGVMFCGQPLAIREYVHRSYSNERRAVNWREKPWRAGERRRNDRRLTEAQAKRDEFESMVESARAREEKELENRADTLEVTAYDSFARKS
ncbi:MAG: hypothetical protein OEZ16_07785 [Chromatiales bacterium]|nr:hypothetical protein [Chromatiales bacterium]